MKKFVTAALVTAMIASMNVASFAEVSFGSGASSDVEWPVNFAFDGQLTVVSGHQTTNYNEDEKIVLNPGDVLYMPLYHETDKLGDDGRPNGTKETVQYTGKIDKDWRINFSSSTKGRIDDAVFYTAQADDSFLKENALYVKINLEEHYDSVKTDKISCGVYISENRTSNKTNQLQVKADYENPNGGYVDFNWINNVTGPTVFEVAKNEDGTARFEFNDDAAFDVPMYSKEKILLNLSRDFDKNIALQYDERAELEFYNFMGTHDSFTRNGVLSIYADKDHYIYEVEDGALVELNSTYDEKEKALQIKTDTLGYYVVSDRELDVVAASKPQEVKPENDSSSKPSNDKVNPNTGADDMLGTAVALAVVSVAAAGALALKK